MSLLFLLLHFFHVLHDFLSHETKGIGQHLFRLRTLTGQHVQSHKHLAD